MQAALNPLILWFFWSTIARNIYSRVTKNQIKIWLKLVFTGFQLVIWFSITFDEIEQEWEFVYNNNFVFNYILRVV